MSAPYEEAAEVHYAALMAALEGQDLEAMRSAAVARMAELGARFGGRPFPVDPVPRLMEAEEWDALAAGIDQRVRALNAFVLDAYGERAIVAAGVVPDRVIEQAEGYEPALRGRVPAGATPIGIAGLDVVREPGGRFLVLEDNCRAPSGFGYALAVREATELVLPLPELPRRAIDDVVPSLLGAVLRDASPVADPFVVVLTDGPHNVAYWEHARLAALTGAALVTWDDVERRGDRVFCGGQQVDVLYRRCDEDRMTGDDGAPTALAELLTEPWTAGTLGLVNGLGSGVADDKLVHAYVEAMVRFYLGEEPLIGSVPTLDLSRPEALAEVLEDLRGFVVKPRGGYGGHGVVVCEHADEETLVRVREELSAAPEGFIAQRTVLFSCLPTIVDGGALAQRHADLRPYTFSSRSGTWTLPGGLTRVAFDEGALVVNSSQDGGAKDTWVLA